MIIRLQLILLCILLISNSVAQTCVLEIVKPSSQNTIKNEYVFYKDDTVNLNFKIKGQYCEACYPVCLNCNDINYTIKNNSFKWIPDDDSPVKRTFKFELSGCSLGNSKTQVLAEVRVEKISYKFQFDFGKETSLAIRYQISQFFNSKSAKLIQIPVNEGDTLSFKISVRKDSPTKLTIYPNLATFEGITYADSKSILVKWSPSYKDYKRGAIRDFRFSISNEILENDPQMISKIIKFKIIPQYNVPPFVDRSRSGSIDLETDGNTYINMADYFISNYDRSDDKMVFDYDPKNTPAIKLGESKNELIVDKFLFLRTIPKLKEIKLRARQSNSAFTDTLRLMLNSSFGSFSIALENRKFAFYDDEKIDEFIKVDINGSYKLDQNEIEITGDTAIFDLKKVLKFDNENPEYLHMFTTKRVEINDSETDDLRFTVNLKFVNILNQTSRQNLTISIHPRVNGDAARLYFKDQVNSLKIFLDTIKLMNLKVKSFAVSRAKRIDWYSKGISFLAIIWGSYGAAKNSANYGYGIAAGLGMGMLFVDLKQIKFFVTKKYLRAKEASDNLSELESDIERHLIADEDKIGVFFFEANYQDSDGREHQIFLNRYTDIVNRYTRK